MNTFRIAICTVMTVLLTPLAAVAAAPGFTMAQAIHYPYESQLVAAERADVIAWVRTFEGVRNIWIARGPDFTPRQVTHYTQDDGQEITQITFAPDGSRLVYVLGGDHDGNWPAEGNLAPDPAASPQQPVAALWTVALSGGAPVKVDEGDAPAISSKGQLVYLKSDHVWTAAFEGGKPELLFFDRGKNHDLRWSPDGGRLAFVSHRSDHAFIGIFTAATVPLRYLSPSTGIDGSPRWSPDGKRLAFIRRPGDGGPPESILTQTPHPWSIWTASAADGSAQRVWRSPNTLAGSYPDVEGEANLHWAGGDRLVFLAYLDDWQHLYSVPSTGGTPLLLTPGAFMVEHVAISRDRRAIIYDANAGSTPGDDDRRHVFRVHVDRADASALTTGETLEWTPVSAAADTAAFVAAGVQTPPSIAIVRLDGSHRSTLADGALAADFPRAQFVTPKPVIFTAADGTRVHGQLFASGSAAAAHAKPAVIFVHGGPPRQMLLGWHYMDYYSNAYAVNQYLAAHGFVVLAVNYRLGIGYGRAFHQPEHASFAGASEYQDVVAGARYLQSLPGVDPARIGLWGGSYGGYLTAMGLSRNSDIFKAGVDLHGVHDWSALLDAFLGKPAGRYEKGDREAAMNVAWTSSPDATIDAWKSPVLLIHGDDDRNVPFAQTVDLARRLDARNVDFEELVLPNEIHGFLLHSTWLRADEATAGYLARKLGAVDQ